MRSTRIMLAQICPQIDSISLNIEKIQNLQMKAFEGGADIVVFPECSLTGYSVQEAKSIAVRKDGEPEEIRKISRKTGITVCFGYVERDGEEFYITQELTDGKKSAFYRKTHLGSREKNVFREGDIFPVMKAPVVTGMQLCWESHIPEISDVERGKGAELLLFPYASPMSGEVCEKNWSVHLPARASDNGVYAAACNLLFPGKGDTEARRGGGMAVFDPKGRRIAERFGTDESVLFCDLAGPLPREGEDEMHSISYFDRKRTELFVK